MPRVAVKIVLSAKEKMQLERNIKSQVVERRIYLRSKIVLLSAEGRECIEIARLLGLSEKTCRKWRNRFAQDRMDGLMDLQRCGAPEIFTEAEREEIIRMACEAPADLGSWTLANLTERVKACFGKSISVETIRLILKSADASSAGNTDDQLKIGVHKQRAVK